MATLALPGLNLELSDRAGLEAAERDLKTAAALVEAALGSLPPAPPEPDPKAPPAGDQPSGNA